MGTQTPDGKINRTSSWETRRGKTGKASFKVTDTSVSVKLLTGGFPFTSLGKRSSQPTTTTRWLRHSSKYPIKWTGASISSTWTYLSQLSTTSCLLKKAPTFMTSSALRALSKGSKNSSYWRILPCTNTWYCCSKCS